MKVFERKIPESIELTPEEQQFLISLSSVLNNCADAFGDNYYDDDACIRDYFDKIVNACQKKQTSAYSYENLTVHIVD